MNTNATTVQIEMSRDLTEARFLINAALRAAADVSADAMARGDRPGHTNTDVAISAMLTSCSNIGRALAALGMETPPDEAAIADEHGYPGRVAGQ